MRSDQLDEAFRLSGFLSDADPDFTESRVLKELTNALHTRFERAVVNTRQGYWLKTSTTTTIAARANYRMPHRAVVGGLEKLEIAGSDGAYTKLVEVTPSRATEYEGSSTTTADPPGHYVVQGDTVRLLPAPGSASYTLRFTYYLRPSRLVKQQSFASTSGIGQPYTERGRITAVDTSARTLVVNVVPFDMELATPAAITTAVQRIDVVHPTGWHELSLVNSTQTLSGTTFTLPSGTDMSEIEVGDYVRAAEQTDWPCLPDDYHQSLADAAASVALVSRGLKDKASILEARVQAAITELTDLMQPRIKNSPRVVKPRFGVIFGAG